MTEDAKNWFSNFNPYNVPINDGLLVYKTPEHYYQAHKSLSHFEKARIAKLDTPGQAKRAGKKINHLRPDWDRVKWIVMFRAQLWRVETDLDFTQRLLETQWDVDTIIETNTWHDQYWGNCTCGKPSCKLPGKNMLGSILMRIRNTLTQGAR